MKYSLVYILILGAFASKLFAVEELQVHPKAVSTEKTQTISLYCPTCEPIDDQEVEISFSNAEFVAIDEIVLLYSTEGVEAVAELRVNMKATLGERKIFVETGGKVIAEGIIIIKPAPPYHLMQGWTEVQEYANRNEDLILSYDKRVFIKVSTTSQTPGENMKEFILSTPIKEADGLLYYDLGSYKAGDEVHVSIYPDSTLLEADIILPNRTVLIRPGPISIRSGFIFILGESSSFEEKIIPSLGLRARIFQSQSIESWALSVGFSMGVKASPQLFNIGLGFEYSNLIGVSVGIVGMDDGKKALSSAPSIEIAMDLRLLKMLVNKVF